MCHRFGIFGFKRYYVMDEGEFVIIAKDVLMKTWFERCIVANIREIKSVHGSDEDAPDKSPAMFNPKKDMTNPPLELATPEAFRKKTAKIAAIDEDATRWFADKPPLK
ncbi:hypothetical protein ACH5RR_037474 [Cinchona calisaya]|uniref:Uncharacterized protein n=1 Tax=Cinchona calisaya TaxID=153742 RepID=A0ABD2YA17_9GENT